jgi:glycosyltransferase involved in cell wall biosynthesis
VNTGVTVITPSIPERSGLLAEAKATVVDQTLQPVVHLVAVDHDRQGPAAIRQQLLDATSTEWVAFLDDDDLLDPHHLHELVHRAAETAADVVIPRCRFDGPPLPTKYCNQPFDRARLAAHGIFPITVLARTSAVIGAGGFDPADRYEDWSLWNRMADRGARFVNLDLVTWTYRTGHADRRTNAA